MIYVAAPDHHLLIDDGYMAVKRGPKENGFRPSIDALFRSAAYSYGPAAIGVVLSGALSDGTSGLWSIKRLRGTAIVQDPRQALYPSMPRSGWDKRYRGKHPGVGPLTQFTCPECRGSVIQIQEGNLSRFRCHTGHGLLRMRCWKR